MLDDTSRNKLNGKLRELLDLLGPDKLYDTVAAFVYETIESLTEIQGEADEYQRKLFRTGWQGFWDKNGYLNWTWFSDIKHDLIDKARYAVCTEMARFVRSATNEYLQQKYAEQLRDACCEYLAREGYEVPAKANETSPPGDPFVPTPLQGSILAALDGKALKVEQLAAQTGVETSRLYRAGGLKELKDGKMVVRKNGVGYYRPDAPPTSAMWPAKKVSKNSS